MFYTFWKFETKLPHFGRKLPYLAPLVKIGYILRKKLDFFN